MFPQFDATWAGVLAGVVGIVAALLLRRWARTDEDRAAEKHRVAELKRSASDWRAALARGDAEGAALAKRRYDYLKAGGAILMLLAACLCLPACRTAVVPAPPPPLLLSRHAMFLESGATVPDLPEGQTRWLLLSVPTGVETMLPGDFPGFGEPPPPE